MKISRRWLVIVPAVLAFAGAGGLTYYATYLRDERSMLKDLETYNEAIDGFKGFLDARAGTEQALRDIAQSTLGFDAESVDARFRTGLQRLAVDAGLTIDEIVVTSQPARAVKNPAVEAKASEFRSYLRNESVAMSDLYVMDAEVRGGGTFTAVMRLLSLAQSQPWIWTVRGMSLKPRDRQASTFDIRLDVSTAFMPDLAPKKPPEDEPNRVDPPAILDPTAAQVFATSAIVQRNVFAPPRRPQQPAVVTLQDPAPEPPPNEPAPTPPTPPPPYHEWRLTGISGSPTQGSLAWMLNVRTGTALLLSPGQGVLDARLVEARPAEAVFQIGQKRYSLALNETLAERHPLD